MQRQQRTFVYPRGQVGYAISPFISQPVATVYHQKPPFAALQAPVLLNAQPAPLPKGTLRACVHVVPVSEKPVPGQFVKQLEPEATKAVAGHGG